MAKVTYIGFVMSEQDMKEESRAPWGKKRQMSGDQISETNSCGTHSTYLFILYFNKDP